MFDARAVMAAYEPPTFVALNGRKYVGQHLSYLEWLPFETRFRALAQGGMNHTELRSLIKDFTRALFPRRPWWNIFRRRATYHILRLPPIPQMQAMWDFMQSQATALGIEVGTLPPGAAEKLGVVEEAQPSQPGT